MGTKKRNQLILLTILFIFASVLIHLPKQAPDKTSKHQNLKQTFNKIEGYNQVSSIPLADEIISFLKVDDYLQSRYKKNGAIIDLYIGYYNSLSKISSAHSPLVCFPGQGWKIHSQSRKQLVFDNEQVNLEEFIAESGNNKQLILYWYQAQHKTTSKLFVNKINAFINKYSDSSEEHAFVRVSLPIHSTKTIEEARESGYDFIATFYTLFLQYVKDH